MAFKLNIVGLKELQVNISKLPDHLQKEVRGVTEASAKTYVRNAKRDAPVDFGVLKNMISYASVISDKSHTTFEIISQAKYSAYLEFGTIEKVNVPGELSDYAAKFKGSGLRTTGGIFPHPYFFPQAPIAKKQLETDLRQIADSIKL